MPEPFLATPVAMLIFNRPETTARVFAAIRAARPQQLLIVADGPRPDRAGDAERCAAARAVVEQIDWPCEVRRNYADVNLGCRRRVSSGLDWVFENVEEAIILEDDCVPHPTFFRFCAELLERYRHDERVMHISGDSDLPLNRRSQASYFFSRYNHIWGWASWRRAWQHYDISMSAWPELRRSGWLKGVLADDRAVAFWTGMMESTYRGQLNTWDVQWTLTCWRLNGLTILPEVNLISNIGYGDEATHTQQTEARLAERPTYPISFPLRHPPGVIRDAQADRWIQLRRFSPPNLLNRAWRRLASRLGRAQ